MGRRKSSNSNTPTPAKVAKLRSVRVPQDRFFLRFTEVLLPKPKFWKLNKSPLVVGFSSNCDVVIPLKEMGINLDYEVRDWEAGIPKVGRTIQETKFAKSFLKDARFELIYRPSYSGVGHWEIGSMFGFGLGLPDFTEKSAERVALNEDEEARRLREEKTKCLLSVEHGEFSVYWPCHHLSGWKHTELPLWFSIFDIKADHPTGGSRLMSLPDEMLGKIASFLSPEEFQRSLARVDRRFSSLTCLIPWQEVALSADSYESLRICKLAKKSEVVKLTQKGNYLAPAFRRKFTEEYKRFMKGAQLRKLSVEYIGFLLRQTGIPAHLVELEIVNDTLRSSIIWTTLLSETRGIDFPRTLSRLKVHSDEETDFGDEDLAEVSGEEFFNRFPNVTVFTCVPMTHVEFWEDAPLENKRRMTSLKMRMPIMSIPARSVKLDVSDMVNLRTLHAPKVDFKRTRLMALETLCVCSVAGGPAPPPPPAGDQGDDDSEDDDGAAQDDDASALMDFSDPKIWQRLAWAAPNVKNLEISLTPSLFYSRFANFTGISKWLPNLEVFVVKNSHNTKREEVLKVLRQLKKLKYFSVDSVSGDGKLTVENFRKVVARKYPKAEVRMESLKFVFCHDRDLEMTYCDKLDVFQFPDP